jgi:hypothetical protein
VAVTSKHRMAWLLPSKRLLASDGPFVVDVVTDRDCLTPVGPYNKMAAEYEYGHHN